MLALVIIILDSIQRTFSPPDNTLLFFKASSPEKIIFPKKPRKNTSSRSSSVFAYCLNQSTKFNSPFWKNSELSADMLSNFDQVANLLGNERVRRTQDLQISGNDRYSGSGQTSRKSQVNAVVTAEVTEILDNGNLFILGYHKVNVNNETQTIRVSGIVRPQDIAGNNTILSSQIAKAEVSIKGSGVVATKQNPGIMTKLFGWFF